MQVPLYLLNEVFLLPHSSKKISNFKTQFSIGKKMQKFNIMDLLTNKLVGF